MRIILGLLSVIAITVAFTGCDKEKMSQESASPAVAEKTTQAEQPQAEQVEQAVPETPAAEIVAVEPPAIPAPDDPDAVVATVNGSPITEGAVFEELNKRMQAMKKRMPEGQEMPQQKKDQMRMSVVDVLAQRMMLSQELAKRNITVSDEKVLGEITKIAAERGQTIDEIKTEIAQYGMTLDDLISQIRPQVEMKELAEACQAEPDMQAEAKKFYDDNPSYFQVPEQVKASHILLGKRGIKPEEKPEYLAKIQEVETQLKAGANFEELAKEYSMCPSAKDGGDLGFFGRGQMDPAFEKAAFELGVGETSGIVESSFGYHIIKVTDKKEAGMKPFEEVQSQIIAYLLQKQMKENLKVEYSEQEQALRDRVEQQQQMQQQIMQQMQAQMAAQQQEKEDADAAANEPAEPKETEAPAEPEPAPAAETETTEEPAPEPVATPAPEPAAEN